MATCLLLKKPSCCAEVKLYNCITPLVFISHCLLHIFFVSLHPCLSLFLPSLPRLSNDTKTDDLKRWMWVYNVSRPKLHRPRISDAFLADTVIWLDYSRVLHLRFCGVLCTARSVSQPRYRDAQLTRYFSAVAELHVWILYIFGDFGRGGD